MFMYMYMCVCIFKRTCGVYHLSLGLTLLLFLSLLSPRLPSPSCLHLSGARPELGGRKTEKKESEKEKGGGIGFPFHIGSLEWSLKPQSVLALDKEAGFNKYVD